MPILIHPHGDPIIDSDPDPRTDPFTDRTQAGRRLAMRLRSLNLPRPRVVVALPRGGVPVAVEVARALRAPLEVLGVRKIGAPGQPEWAVAAVASRVSPEGVDPQPRDPASVPGDLTGVVLNESAVQAQRIPTGYIEQEAARQRRELQRRERLYGSGVTTLGTGTTVIVVDDGLATGTTARAALAELRRRGASRLVLAVPVGPPSTIQALGSLCDEVVCLLQPMPFSSVGEHYRHFPQVEDEEVTALLAQARSEGPVSPVSPPAPATPESISASISRSP